ncbi:MAG: acyl-CoA synthetase [Burkholderiales bacterium]|nr:acyl-CoA synthetase [Burkholderiales bacterium]
MTPQQPRRHEHGTETPAWLLRRERGSLAMLRFMTWLSLALGRRLTRPIVYGIALYFLLAVPAARAASRAYLQRVLGRRAGWGELYRHILAFAGTIHDRVYLLNDRHELFDIRVFGEDLLPDAEDASGGLLIFGAHLGSFEVLRTLARKNARHKVCAAMYPQNARLLNSMLARVNAQVVLDIIPLGQLDAIFTLNERVQAGAWVALLADRAVGPDPHLNVSFFGETAPFPTGPFRLAAIVRRPVFFMTGLYRGGNRYDIHFERLADFSASPAGQRDATMRAAIERYAQLIELHCRLAPYNWFNFYDFWKETHRAPR